MSNATQPTRQLNVAVVKAASISTNVATTVVGVVGATAIGIGKGSVQGMRDAFEAHGMQMPDWSFDLGLEAVTAALS